MINLIDLYILSVNGMSQDCLLLLWPYLSSHPYNQSDAFMCFPCFYAIQSAQTVAVYAQTWRSQHRVTPTVLQEISQQSWNALKTNKVDNIAWLGCASQNLHIRYKLLHLCILSFPFLSSIVELSSVQIILPYYNNIVDIWRTIVCQG